MQSLGCVLYEGYRSQTPHLPGWDDLTDEQKQLWEVAAEASSAAMNAVEPLCSNPDAAS